MTGTDVAGALHLAISMAFYRIIVQNKRGYARQDCRVALGVEGFWGGVTSPVYTDEQGIALVKVEAGGTVTVYVDGVTRGRTGPGDFLVTTD